MNDPSDIEKVRIDRWLLAARFFKTRSRAVAALDGGKVQLNGSRAKRSRTVKVGDQIRVRKGPYEYHLTVKGLAVRRGPAAEAEKLYEEAEASIQARAEITAQMKAARPVEYRGKGRPTKKARRALDRFRKE